MHNDSGDGAGLFVSPKKGRHLGVLTGIEAVDFEDIANEKVFHFDYSYSDIE